MEQQVPLYVSSVKFNSGAPYDKRMEIGIKMAV